MSTQLDSLDTIRIFDHLITVARTQARCCRLTLKTAKLSFVLLFTCNGTIIGPLPSLERCDTLDGAAVLRPQERRPYIDVSEPSCCRADWTNRPLHGRRRSHGGPMAPAIDGTGDERKMAGLLSLSRFSPPPSLWISQLTHLSLSLFGSPSLSRSRSRSDDPSLSVSLWFTLHLLLAVEKSPSLLIYLKISPPFEKDHPQKASSRGPSSRPFLHRSRPKPPTAAIHASSSLRQEETKSPLFIETIGGSVELKLLSSVAFLAIVASKWVVLVRHGQSTWNEEGWIQGSSEEGRIQGSSDYVVVTNKGEAQAETSRQMLLTNTFHVYFHKYS
ncbi:hypothetical protein ACLOJK_018122 [Asimina triloba]